MNWSMGGRVQAPWKKKKCADDDDPVSNSFRAVSAKRDSLSEHDLNPESYKCTYDEHCLKEIPREQFVNLVASIKLLMKWERSR